jgi:hypothetical protein
MRILVSRRYKCRECGTGRLAVTDASDDTMTVECDNPGCVAEYEVETDAFGDGGVDYWPAAMAEKLEGEPQE